MRRSVLSTATVILCGGLLALGACNKKTDKSNAPGSNLLGPSGSGGSDELGDLDEPEEDNPWDETGDSEGLEGGDEPAAAPRKKLPKRAKATKRCRGKGKKRVCKMTDPKPKVSAAHGVVALMNDFRWGMSPSQVFKVLSKGVEEQYAKRTKTAKDAMAQDQHRVWRKDQLAAIKANHIKFTQGSKHRWGVSLIQYEYEDDNSEEMLWVKTGTGLRKFYFFKDGELWKIFYAYSTDTWPGKSYAQVVDEKFYKWFGPSPKVKSKLDPKTKAAVLTYNEWTAMDGEKIRSFDMTQVHGVIALAVVDGNAEGRIGERLPNIKKEEGYSDVISDVLGGSDVCYTPDGDIVECGEGKGRVKID